MQVPTVSLELRTVKLTKSLLLQIPKLERLPKDSHDAQGNILPERCVGWVHGSVLGDKLSTAIIFITEDGYGVYVYSGSANALKGIKRVYIVYGDIMLDCIPSILRLICIVVLASFLGYAYGLHCARTQAIEAGVGRWNIDSKTGEREFVFGS